jgi:hypothetical protein
MRMRPTFALAALLTAASAATAAEPVARVAVPTCPGRGYVPYSYPAIGSCPCGDDGCFDPGRYYACDDAYRKSFWRRWRRAHLCGGSMLNGVPCRCVVPPGRPVSGPLREPKPEREVVPVPAAAPPSQAPASEDAGRTTPGENVSGGAGLAPPAPGDVNF